MPCMASRTDLGTLSRSATLANPLVLTTISTRSQPSIGALSRIATRAYHPTSVSHSATRLERASRVRSRPNLSVCVTMR